MSVMQWLAISGVVLFLVVLFALFWAYAAGRLKAASNQPRVRLRWLPHSLRTRPLGHGIYHAHDERRAERQARDARGDSG
ncbi:MAG: hypothetical protein M3N53_06115 [Actinomycetota bacterium]|nr:hypothetical protein [Actinomycetota bacterium]